MSWKVYRAKTWIGIVETNYEWAAAYWIPKGFKLIG